MAGLPDKEDFQPKYAPNLQDFSRFLGELSELLDEIGMEVRVGRENSERGKGWIALVSRVESALGWKHKG